MAMKNEIMLITYADSMGKNLSELNDLLHEYMRGIVGGVHILPFYPSSADRGFAPLGYDKVDDRFGCWDNLEKIGKDFYLMYDFMINHISKQSFYFKDFKKKKDASHFRDMFIRYKDFWPEGEPCTCDIDLIYRRKSREPYVEVEFDNGTIEKVWCTFGEEQIDLNVNSDITKKFIKESLEGLGDRGASIIRLDAFAYAIKKLNTSCFFVKPEVWELLDNIKSILKPYNVEILPEIHENYKIQLELSNRGYFVYDFALPMLLLYTLHSGCNKKLVNWLKTCPRRQFTTLDTHDGIGVVDTAGLLSDEEINETREKLFSKGANVKKIYNTAAYNNLDIYQINCTYYSALGNDDDMYVLSRAVQFFAPGIPQVYYVGLLAGENDIKLLENTKQGRNINRHYYSKEEVEENIKRPVVKRLFNLMKFRNSYPAFNGEFKVIDTNENKLKLKWKKNKYEAALDADLKTYKFKITYFDEKTDSFKYIENV